jgi:hypothetical protein
MTLQPLGLVLFCSIVVQGMRCPVGMENGVISDAGITTTATASSHLRLNRPPGTVPDVGTDPVITVTLFERQYITSFALQGAKASAAVGLSGYDKVKVELGLQDSNGVAGYSEPVIATHTNGEIKGYTEGSEVGKLGGLAPVYSRDSVYCHVSRGSAGPGGVHPGRSPAGRRCPGNGN